MDNKSVPFCGLSFDGEFLEMLFSMFVHKENVKNLLYSHSIDNL